MLLLHSMHGLLKRRLAFPLKLQKRPQPYLQSQASLLEREGVPGATQASWHVLKRSGYPTFCLHPVLAAFGHVGSICFIQLCAWYPLHFPSVCNKVTLEIIQLLSKSFSLSLHVCAQDQQTDSIISNIKKTATASAFLNIFTYMYKHDWFCHFHFLSLSV